MTRIVSYAKCLAARCFVDVLPLHASQVIYPLHLVQQSWLKYILAINPVNTAIELFRHPFSGSPVDMTIIGIGVASTMIISLTGLYYFRKTEAYFADLA